jgi:two-component system chemotaxis response regulator CheV
VLHPRVRSADHYAGGMGKNARSAGDNPLAQQSNILLEAGTNELEVLVCAVGGTRYGVNVAKVREVIKAQKTTRLPRCHRAMVGAFLLRDAIIPLIDLHIVFELAGDPPPRDERRIIVMEFNNVRVGFMVDDVDRIHRVSWASMSAAPNVEGMENAPITSICRIEEKIVLMIDFEKIVFDVSGHDLFKADLPAASAGRNRPEVSILLAEDSPMMRKLITGNLGVAGYTGVTPVEDGQHAWELLQADIGSEKPAYDLLITDIEMPRLDGLALTRRIKENPQTRRLPVVVFSSLVSPDNMKKIQAVNADGQITKPELPRLVELIDGLLDKVAAAKQTELVPVPVAVPVPEAVPV